MVLSSTTILNGKLLRWGWIFKYNVALAINIDVVPIETQVHFGKLGLNLCLLFRREIVQLLLERRWKGRLELVIRPGGWIVSFKNIVQLSIASEVFLLAKGGGGELEVRLC